jgi:hypothetical protein
MAYSPRRVLNPAQQMVALRVTVPGATGTVRRGILACTLPIQPSPMSLTYTVQILQQHGKQPRVSVIDPPLQLHPGSVALPHVYHGDELCLHYPSQWKPTMLLANTIVPWTAEWLMHYELWLVTGEWTGGGDHP